jgi:hypothetical protein
MESLRSKLGKLERGGICESEPLSTSATGYREDVAIVVQREELPARAEPQIKVEEPVKEKAPEKRAGTVVFKALDIEQNPFAMMGFEREQPRPKITGAADLQAQIGAIMERINDLASFDVTTITQRYDPRVRELRDSVNSTIADVFGRNTRDYWDHSLASFESAHVVLGSPNRSSSELMRNYKDGIDKAVRKLTAIVESLRSRLNQSESRDS